MNSGKTFKTMATVVLMIVATAAHAQVPPIINYQGQLLDGSGKPANGNFTIVFSIFDVVSGGTALYTETQSLTVTNGLFSALIGSVTPIPLTLFDSGPNRWLEITANGTVLSPRRQFGSVPYAFSGPGGGSGSGPWLLSGSNAYYSGGSVGIGTDKPGLFPGAYRYLTISATDLYTSKAAALELQGGSANLNAAVARIDFSSVAPSGVWNNIARIHAERGIAANDGELVFFTHDQDSLKEAMRIDYRGNIGMGIGTISPTHKLAVAGTVSATAFVGDGSGLTNLPVGPWITSGSNVYYNNGNVGIGTTNPTQKLTVVGTVSATAFVGNGSGLTNLPNPGLSLPYVASGNAADTNAVFRINNSGSGYAISGVNTASAGVAHGIYGRSRSSSIFSAAVFGEHTQTGNAGIGVYGRHAASGVGVYGYAPSGFGVYGTSTSGSGVFGSSTSGQGVYGNSTSSSGVLAISSSGVALTARTNGAGDILQALRNSSEVFSIDQYGKVNLTPSTSATGSAAALTIKNSTANAIVQALRNSTEVVRIDEYGRLTLSPSGSVAGSGAAFTINNPENTRSVEIQQTGANQAVFIRHTAPSSNALRIQVDDIAEGNEVIQVTTPEIADDNTQFFQATRGTDIEFRINGNGDVFADGSYRAPADFAEMIEVSSGHASVEPGDVMVISTDHERAVRKSDEANSPLVFGIYSTNPGYIGSERPWDAKKAGNTEVMLLDDQYMKDAYDEVPVAVIGIVPCKASAENGPIKPGDLLVTSTTPGHAMKAPEHPRAGTIVGKSLGSLASGTGKIKVYVTVH